jgi:hypothetical protein
LLLLDVTAAVFVEVFSVDDGMMTEDVDTGFVTTDEVTAAALVEDVVLADDVAFVVEAGMDVEVTTIATLDDTTAPALDTDHITAGV